MSRTRILRPLQSARYALEFAGLRTGLFLFERLPPRAAVGLASALGGAWFLLDAKRRRIASENIRLSNLAGTPEDAVRIARASFRHLGTVPVESMRFALAADRDTWRQYVEVDIAPSSMAVLTDPSRPALLLSAHHGNWEIAAQLMGLFRPVWGVARNMRNPLTDRLIQERTSRKRLQTLPKHGATREMYRILGRGGALAMLIDQHARSGSGAVRIDFLGRPAAAYSSPARLHLATGATLLFGCCIRTGPMAFRMTIGDPIEVAKSGDRDRDTRAIIERLTRELEAAIRLHPEQYLWAHRRWR